MYFIMILLCGFYGLLFLPALLDVIGSTRLPQQKSTEDCPDQSSYSNSVNAPLTINSDVN